MNGETRFYSYFTNSRCECFPCHEHIDPKNFNCLFCFCPMYFLERCLGNPYYLENGIKDCTRCTVPHNPQNYDKIMEFVKEEIKKSAEKRKAENVHKEN